MLWGKSKILAYIITKKGERGTQCLNHSPLEKQTCNTGSQSGDICSEKHHCQGDKMLALGQQYSMQNSMHSGLLLSSLIDFPKCLFSSILRSSLSSVSLSCICAHHPPTGSTHLPSLLIYPTVLLESSLPTALVSSLNGASTSWTPIKVDALLYRRQHIPPITQTTNCWECSRFPLVSAQLIRPSHTEISHYQNFLLFNFYHSLWPWCSQCPRSPSLWHQASRFHHHSGWFQCSWGKPTWQSWHSCLQFLPLFSLGHLPPGLYTMLFHSPKLCDPKLSYSILRTFPILAPLFLWPVQDH